jgi:hypothetical protein
MPVAGSQNPLGTHIVVSTSRSAVVKPKLAAVALFAGLALVTMPAAAQHMDLNTIVLNVGSTKFLRALDVVSEAASVRVQRLSTLTVGPNTAGWVMEKLAPQQRHIRDLQRAVALNPIAMLAVRNSNVRLDQIIGVEALGGNAAVIYANDL